MKESRECISCKKSGLLNRMECFVSKFAPRRKAERNQSRTKAFETISLPNPLIQRQPVRQKRSRFEDDGWKRTAKPLCQICAKKEGTMNPNHVRKTLKLSLFPVDWYKGELSCPFITRQCNRRGTEGTRWAERTWKKPQGNGNDGWQYFRFSSAPTAVVSVFAKLHYQYIICYSRFRSRRRKSCALRELFYSVLVFERLYF